MSLQQILPECVCLEETYGSLEGVLHVEEMKIATQFSAKRRAEFRNGRLCAHRALKRLMGITHPVLVGEMRQPLWPPGVVGSITHCPGYCAVALSYEEALLTIGIDAEPNLPLPDGTLDLIALQTEASDLKSLAVQTEGWDRLLFCAKEAFFKAWFPRTLEWLDFHDVEVQFDRTASTFRASVLPQRLTGFVLAHGVDGRYLIERDFIFASVCLGMHVSAETPVNVTSGSTSNRS